MPFRFEFRKIRIHADLRRRHGVNDGSSDAAHRQFRGLFRAPTYPIPSIFVRQWFDNYSPSKSAIDNAIQGVTVAHPRNRHGMFPRIESV